MRALFCGSREWTDAAKIRETMEMMLPTGASTTVVHGGARGADTIADRHARNRGHKIEVHPADWDKYGKSAGFKRNIEMLESGIDVVYAFQVNGSRGTQHTIDEATKRGIKVVVLTSV